jgi:glycosyltransferase involved in cell wall biosynthesis
VMTVHDFKPVCPSYLAYTESAPCRRCVTGHPGHVVVHRCIRNSLTASMVAAAEAVLTRTRNLYHRINAFVVPSEHRVNVLVEGGLPADRMHMIPNFVADEQFGVSNSSSEGRDPLVLFVGRLEEAKGIEVLLDAARRVAPGVEVEIVVIGTGPLERDVQNAAREGGVRYLGPQRWSEIAELMDRACALVVPSLCEENCPMVVLEAGARGCPVVASDRGGLTEMVNHGKDGLLFPAGDSFLLAQNISSLASNKLLREQLSVARRNRTRECYTADTHYPRLLKAYSAAGIVAAP